MAQASSGWRQNINREGCVSDEKDFASVRLTTQRIHLLATEYGIWRCHDEAIKIFTSDKNFSNREFNPTRFLAAFELRNMN